MRVRYLASIMSKAIVFFIAATFASAHGAVRVATDIPPIHSLAAMVTEGVSTPDLVIQPGASPHSYSLRPSEAAALERADVVFWMGEALTPWLGNALNNLASDAQSVALLDRHETLRFDFRDAVMHAEQAHETLDSHDAHGHEGHEGHEVIDTHQSHDHHHDHEAVDTHESHDAIQDTHESHDDHAHEGVDPHAWLDPVNARRWLGVIADSLAQADPSNAATYQANASAAQDRIDKLIADTQATLEPIAEEPFIVFHDAYQYFEKRFGLNALGAIALSDARDPSAAQIAAVQTLVRENSVRCVFAEPQFNASLVDTVLDGTNASTGILDPVGTAIPTGPNFYPQLIEALSENLRDCLAQS